MRTIGPRSIVGSRQLFVLTADYIFGGRRKASGQFFRVAERVSVSEDPRKPDGFRYTESTR